MTDTLVHAAPLARAAHAAFLAARHERWIALGNARQTIEVHYRQLTLELAQHATDIGLPLRHRGAMRDLMRAMMDLRVGTANRVPGQVDRALREIARTAGDLAAQAVEAPPARSNIIRFPMRRVAAFLAPSRPGAA